MINVSKISHRSLLGKFLRGLLRLIPKSAVVVILQGKNKGLKWIKGSGNNTYWLGTYERDKQEVLARILKEGMIFYDIGAHVGFYTLLAAHIVGSSGRAVAFEPSSRNVKYIKKNVELNNMKNVIVKMGAVSDKDGQILFHESQSTARGYVSEKGEIKVPSFQIDTLCGEELPPPQVVKIDVQGGILQVLRGMENTLQVHKPVLFIAIDNGSRVGVKPFKKRDILEQLQRFGYQIHSLEGDKITSENSESYNEIIGESL